MSAACSRSGRSLPWPAPDWTMGGILVTNHVSSRCHLGQLGSSLVECCAHNPHGEKKGKRHVVGPNGRALGTTAMHPSDTRKSWHPGIFFISCAYSGYLFVAMRSTALVKCEWTGSQRPSALSTNLICPPARDVLPQLRIPLPFVSVTANQQVGLVPLVYQLCPGFSMASWA